jgi:ribonuclease P protein component
MLDRRFPKQLRLHQKSEIADLFRDGHFCGLGLVSMKYQPSPATQSRFLVAVRKKVGSAPIRNRLKRQLREAIRHQKHRLRSSYDICFMITKPPQRPVDYAYVERTVRHAFQKLNSQPLP